MGKIGVYTITVTATAGCTESDPVTYTLTILSGCEDDVLNHAAVGNPWLSIYVFGSLARKQWTDD